MMDKIIAFIEKIGVVKCIMLLGCGVALLVLSSSGDSTKNKSSTDNVDNNIQGYEVEGSSDQEYVKNMEAKITEMIVGLNNVDSAKVFITLKSGSKKIVLTETPYSKSNTNESENDKEKSVINEDKNYNTVYAVDSEGNEIPYVVSVSSPEILGVAVTVTGNISSKDIENIINMIETLTNIGKNNIMVISS